MIYSPLRRSPSPARDSMLSSPLRRSPSPARDSMLSSPLRRSPSPLRDSMARRTPSPLRRPSPPRDSMTRRTPSPPRDHESLRRPLHLEQSGSFNKYAGSTCGMPARPLSTFGRRSPPRDSQGKFIRQ
jgi:hypothetical protein